MAATPQYGTMTFYGMSSRKSYIKDIYISDVANASVRFDAGTGASATSPVDLSFPEPVVMADMSIVTGTVDTTKMQLTRDGMPTGDVLRYSIHLTTLANRPRLSIGIRAGVRFAANQLT